MAHGFEPSEQVEGLEQQRAGTLGRMTTSNEQRARDFLQTIERDGDASAFYAPQALWTGTLKAGGELKAEFGMFLTFHDGQIVEQRNYDCFLPRQA